MSNWLSIFQYIFFWSVWNSSVEPYMLYRYDIGYDILYLYIRNCAFSPVFACRHTVSTQTGGHMTVLENEVEVLCLFAFWLRPPKTWLQENLKPSFSAHPVNLHNILVRPSGFDDTVTSVSMALSPRSFVSSSPLRHFLLSVSSSPFSCSFCAVFKWIPLRKLVSERSSAASTDLPRGLSSFFSFCCSFLFLSVLVFIRSAVPPNAAVAEQTYTHKTHCSPTKQMAGWECQMLCYFIPTNTISGDAAPTREPQGAPGLSQKCRQSYKANCSVVSLRPSFLHYRQFIWTSWKPEWLCVLYVCLCVHGCIYCICVCLICSACLIMLTRDDGLEE